MEVEASTAATEWGEGPGEDRSVRPVPKHLVALPKCMWTRRVVNVPERVYSFDVRDHNYPF